MSVESYAAGDLFTMRVVKSLSTNPADKWVNSYEVGATLAGSTDELLALGVKLVTFERSLTLNTVQFIQLIISTWEPDSKPYDPAAFISSPLSLVGNNNALSDPLPLSACLSLTRVAASGRFGHIFLRGVLQDGDVSAPAGKYRLNSIGAFNGRLADAITDSGLADTFTLAGDGKFRLVMVGKLAASARPVVGLVVQGVSQVPSDHAWFNRTKPVTP